MESPSFLFRVLGIGETMDSIHPGRVDFIQTNGSGSWLPQMEKQLWRGGIEKKGTLTETTNDATTWLTIKPYNI